MPPMASEVDEYRKLIVHHRNKVMAMTSDENTKLWFADLTTIMEDIYVHIELRLSNRKLWSKNT